MQTVLTLFLKNILIFAFLNAAAEFSRRRHLFWSRKRESNPPKSAWEADAIPIGDTCVFGKFNITQINKKEK